MRSFEIYNSIIPRIFGMAAITLYPFVFYSDKRPSVFVRAHEYVHVMQIRCFGFFYFYAMYLYEYFSARFNGASHFDAYWSISFEVEARKLQWSTEIKRMMREEWGD